MGTKTCTRCKKEFNQNMRLCPFCNMPSKIPPTKDKALCPKCKVELQPKTFREVELDVCPSCEGLWSDTLAFEYLTSPKDVYSDPETESEYIILPPQGTEKLLECVRCDNFMNRINFKSISGILIDICCDHGIWLDKDELTRIRNFIGSGGLDKFQDLEIAKSKGELQRLAGRVDNIEFLQDVLHRWDWRRILFRGKI